MEILLVGNKNDLEEERVVSYEEGDKMALENGLIFIEINAKDYGKVEEAFKKVTSSILAKVESGKLPINQGIGIKVGDQPSNKESLSVKKEKGGSCC